MKAALLGLKDMAIGLEHGDLDRARLQILRYAFTVFGWMGAISAFATAINWLFASGLGRYATNRSAGTTAPYPVRALPIAGPNGEHQHSTKATDGYRRHSARRAV